MSAPTLTKFMDDLASAEPTPGGGGAAAAMGSMGVALLSMVARLTLGKKGYEGVTEEMQRQLDESEALRVRLFELVDLDAQVFNQLMAAYRLPKENDDQKATRSEAIQSGLQEATRVPLTCAEACAAGIRLAARSAEIGNRNVISDTGAGVLALLAALRASALNVSINVPSIKNGDFAEMARSRTASLMEECLPLAEAVHERVKARMQE